MKEKAIVTQVKYYFEVVSQKRLDTFALLFSSTQSDCADPEMPDANSTTRIFTMCSFS